MCGLELYECSFSLKKMNFELFVTRIESITWSLFTVIEVKQSIIAFAFYCRTDGGLSPLVSTHPPRRAT
jgi:hypothetical protein